MTSVKKTRKPAEKKASNIVGKLKCRLGFHDFQFSHVDEQFMPKVRILCGECTRCHESQNFFEFFDTKKIVVRNFGIERVFFGEVTVMPLEVSE